MKPRLPKLSALPRDARAPLAAARTLARARGARLYLAGGVVRDLLAGHPVRDVDLVVEGDGVEFARALASRLGAAVRVHDRFGTATLTLPAGKTMDVASTRRETYAAPGALPDVAFPATIQQDLARRDFTVNAMAFALGFGFGMPGGVVDPFGGRTDLSRGVLRVLHAESFEDDPTRALRAVRYANRYGLRLDPATRRALRRAAEGGAFSRVSGDRVRRELAKLLEEPGRASAVRWLRRLGLDAAIAAPLARTTGAGARLAAAEALAREETGATGWLAFLLAWLGALPADGVRRVAERLSVSGDERVRLLAWPATRRRLSRGLAERRPSVLARKTAGLSREELVAAAAGLPAQDRRALKRLTRSLASGAGVRLSIRGADLLAAGVPAGAAIGQALARTRDALLDGVIAPPDQLAFAVREARKRRGRT